MDFWSLHPTLYQVCHPWHWLTYGQNAVAFGIFTAFINLFVALVLWRTLNAVNRQSRAADRQAEAAEAQAVAARKQAEVSEQQRLAAERAASAAEEQVIAARAGSAVSDAQRTATEQAAATARIQSELIRHQILAKMRPVLAVDKRIHPLNVSSWQFWLENHGEGVALSIQAFYRDDGHSAISLSANTLGPGRSTILAINIERAQSKGFQVFCNSEDGRRFATTIKMEGFDFSAETFEINAVGGWMPQPELPKTN